MFGWLSISALSRRAMRSTTSFSRRPLLPIAPGSSPPWPGSSAMVSMRCLPRPAEAGGGRRRNRRGGLLAARQRRLGRRVVLAAWIALDVFQDAGQRIVDVGTALLVDHRDQRILRDLGIQVQHQAVLIVGNGLEREHLRRHRLLQVEHHPHHVGPVLRHAQALDIGVVGPDLGHQIIEGRIDGQALDVHHQAVGIFQRELFRLELAVQLQRDAGVFVGRPGPHRGWWRPGRGVAIRGGRAAWRRR